MWPRGLCPFLACVHSALICWWIDVKLLKILMIVNMIARHCARFDVRVATLSVLLTNLQQMMVIQFTCKVSNVSVINHTFYSFLNSITNSLSDIK